VSDVRPELEDTAARPRAAVRNSRTVQSGAIRGQSEILFLTMKNFGLNAKEVTEGVRKISSTDL
jgi:hypothetical protein